MIKHSKQLMLAVAAVLTFVLVGSVVYLYLANADLLSEEFGAEASSEKGSQSTVSAQEAKFDRLLQISPAAELSPEQREIAIQRLQILQE